MALSKRCVHLDFHTSPDIMGIGKNFSKENFQNALKEGNIESITVFAKCHHGLCYYPTKVGTMHPGLDFDLLGEMLDAAHEIGVKAPIYITAGWSDLDATEHPEWCAKQNGEIMKRNYETGVDPDTPRPEVSWIDMCLNDGEYCQHIYELTEEICKRYKTVDGLFYDIVFVGGKCTCEHCVDGMKALGMDPENKGDQAQYFEDRHLDFMRKCRDILHSYHPDATLFFNSGGADPSHPHRNVYETHFELEDLPTAWGGYDKMPLRAKYFSKTGKDFLGMTGKFHLAWGEFGGYKAKEALKYEIASMSLYGAGASIGDHMHPDGKMETATYKNIGYAYNYLEKISPYAYNGTSTARVGIYSSNNYNESAGLSNILLENQIDYDIVFDNRFEEFDTVIIPSDCVLDEDGEKKLLAYVENGGKLLFMGNSLIKDNRFIVDCGAEHVGHNQFDRNYIELLGEYEGIPQASVLCYCVSQDVRATDGTVYAQTLNPYFSRTYAHFCGHKNTPQDRDSVRYAGIVKKGNVVYVAHPLCSNYFLYGAVVYKYLVKYALELLAPDCAFEMNIGAQGRATMIKQENRYCLNMTYASPVRRGCAEIIEDIMPLYNIPVKINVPEKIKRVYSPVNEIEYTFTQTEKGIEFTVDKLHCHNSIVIEF